MCPHPTEDLLRDAGLTTPVVDRTPLLSGLPASCERGYEINAHIKASGVLLRDIVVFDDDRGAQRVPPGSEIPHGGRVILTPEATGLDAKHLIRARRLFLG